MRNKKEEVKLVGREKDWLTRSQAGTHPNLIVGWSSSCPANSLNCTLQRPLPTGLHHDVLWAELTHREVIFHFPSLLSPFLPSKMLPPSSPFLSHFYPSLSSLYPSLSFCLSFWDDLYCPDCQNICSLSFCLSFHKALWLHVRTTTTQFHLLSVTLNLKLGSWRPETTSKKPTETDLDEISAY